MELDMSLLKLQVYFHPLSLDCWRNKKIITEFINITAMDCEWVDVSEWTKADIKQAKIEAVPRMKLLYFPGKELGNFSGAIASIESFIGWVNGSVDRAGFTSVKKVGL